MKPGAYIRQANTRVVGPTAYEDGDWCVLRKTWRARRRLRPLVRRPRSRELLDRCGLIVRVLYIEAA